jgi:integrase
LDYLTRDKKTGRLSYRRLYPFALRPFIPAPSTELKVSLAATRLEAPGAIAKFRNAAAQYDATVTNARKASQGMYDALTPELTTFLIAAYRAEQLALDEEVRWLDRPLAMKTRAALSSRQIIAGELAECRALRALGDVAAIVHQWTLGAIEYADSHEIRLDQTTPAFALYCRAFNDVNIEIWEAMEQRLDGRSVPTPPMPLAPPQAAKLAPPTNAAETFEAIAEAQLTNVRTPASATTLQASRTALRFLSEALGPVTPPSLTRKAISEWLDLMAVRPSRVPSAQQSLSLQELAALYANRPEVPRLSPKTLDGHLGTIAALWRKARSAGTIDELIPDPFKDRKSATGPKRRGPKGFSPSELQSIFALPIFTAGHRPRRGRGEASYWLPLMLLWSGARPEEIAQMTVADIAPDAETARWMMTITDTGHHPVKGPQSLKTTKSDSGVRSFPVPQALIDLGLLDYLEWLRARGDKALFPRLTLKSARKLLFPSFGEWWSLYLRENDALAVGGGRQPAREFRHTWTTAARASGIPQDAREYLQGHSAANGTANEGYGEQAPLGLTIDKLTFAGLDLSGVKHWTASKA